MTRKAATGWRATRRRSAEWGAGCCVAVGVDMICLLRQSCPQPWNGDPENLAEEVKDCLKPTRPVGNPGGEGTCLTESVLKNASARSMGLGVRNSSTARLARALFCSPDMAALPFSCARVRSTVVLRENDKLSGDFSKRRYYTQNITAGSLANNSCCTTRIRRELLLPLKGRVLLSVSLGF